MDIFKDKPISSYSISESIKIISKCLNSSCVALFLGSGISKRMGLPLWWELVDRCLKKTEKFKNKYEINSSTPVKELKTVMEDIEYHYKDTNDFLSLVTNQLYFTLDKNNNFNPTPLLVSLGSLLIPSARGSINTIVTYNYDDLIEWYLTTHGFVIKSIFNDSYSLYPKSDVRIYHPHGYLPNPDREIKNNMISIRSNFLIFSEESFEKRFSEYNNFWQKQVESILSDKIGLFIGLSGNDTLLMSSLRSCEEKIKAALRPTGFWFVGPDNTNKDDFFYRRNIVPMRFSHHDDYSDAISQIAQLSAENRLVSSLSG